MNRFGSKVGIPLAVALAAVTFTSVPSAHSAEFQKVQAPGFFRMKLGEFEVTALYDGGGAGAFKPEMFHAKANEIISLLKDGLNDPDKIIGSDTSFLVNTGEKLILVDAGTGGRWGGPALGKLTINLAASGYRPDQVDIVLLTHLHADHAGGITSLDGKRVFPNAEIRVAKQESDFWLSEEIAKKAPKEAQEFFETARQVAAPYVAAGKWKTFSGVEEIAPGVKTHPIYGHTPGHTGYEFTSKGQTLLAWGDVIHQVNIQLPRPEISIVYDSDGAAAVKARLPLLKAIVAEKTLIAGAHMPFPGIGHLRKDGRGYAWLPVSYLGTP
jgi:glyoxylase-like metal-dependent hydrolase (beta-lactamase superfamily II)